MSPSSERGVFAADGIRCISLRRALGRRPNACSSRCLPTASRRECARRERRRGVVEHDTPLDAERILAALAEHAVDYVIVGGLAVQTHGHVRTTFDVDVYPRPEPANLRRLADALNELEARTLNVGGEG